MIPLSDLFCSILDFSIGIADVRLPYCTCITEMAVYKGKV